MAEIITDMTNDEYHSCDAIGSSGLCLIKRSPAHYWAKYIDPEREPDESTAAQKIGTATHMAMLEPDIIESTYVLVPDGVDRRSNAGKQLFKDIESSGKIPVKQDEMTTINRIAKSVRQLKHFKAILQFKHFNETSIFIIDENTGIKCKIRPDLFIEPCSSFPNGFILDLKSTTDASEEGFGKSVMNYDYLIQNAWYVDIFQAYYKTKEPPPFAWLAYEKESPFAKKIHFAEQWQTDYGREQYKKLYAIYVECKKTNVWPGYDETPCNLQLPVWAENVIKQSLTN